MLGPAGESPSSVSLTWVLVLAAGLLGGLAGSRWRGRLGIDLSFDRFAPRDRESGAPRSRRSMAEGSAAADQIVGWPMVGWEWAWV